MRAAGDPTVTDLPVGAGWSFGGFAYGLEPLVLPHPGEPDAGDGRKRVIPAPSAALAECCERIRLLGVRGPLAPEVDRCAAWDELFWFRWITGHQVCFVIWRLMAQLLDGLNRGRYGPETVFSRVCRYVHGYSAMLLYTGSCPRDIYQTLIRPSMRLRHRSFSGAWAPDYWPVRDLFRGRLAALMSVPGTDELIEAIRLHHLVHDGVAARLVPDGRSLLRQSAVRAKNPQMLSAIYESYFMTLRAPVTRHEVVAQLLRRLVAIAQDIAANSLYVEEAVLRTGEEDTLDGWPTELRAAEVAYGSGLVDTLFEVARCACGQARDERTEPLEHSEVTLR